MKSFSNRVLVITLAVCALSFWASTHLAKMHGQEKVAIPADIAEELPGRGDADPPIIFGNQTPFGRLPETASREPATTNAAPETQTQTVNRPNFDILENPPTAPQTEGILPDRNSPDPGSLDGMAAPVAVGQPLGFDASHIGAPMIGNPIAQPMSITPPLAAPVTLNTTPVSELDIASGSGCSVCGSTTCNICCQPKCITKSILVPQYRTVWSSIFETRYRTEVKEEAYTIEQEVEHQVPRIIQETVMVAEPRIRTFQDFRTEEEQYPVEEEYTVMVRKPRQRMVPVEREETYRYPVEQEYTVMVPQEKIVSETKYKTIVDKEARQKKYTEEIEVTKKRVVVDYVDKEIPVTKRVAVTRVVPKTYTRPEIRYRNKTVTDFVEVPYYEYLEEIQPYRTLKPEVIEKTRTVAVGEVDYESKTRTYEQPRIEQVVKKTQIPETYTVAVPEVVKAYENFTRSVPYTEDVTISWETRKQESREVTRQYTVRIPYIENIPRQYKVKVPVQLMKKGERFVPKQIPRTKYQTVKRDVGKWVTTVCTIPTYEIEADRCGCSTCCPKTRTVRKTVWQPKIVNSKIPYTVFETVKKKVPFEYPVLKETFETRTRMEPVTRYRTETREVKLTVYDFKPETATKTVKVRKFKQVPDRREIEVQRFRTEQRTRMVDVEEYEKKEVASSFSVDAEEPFVASKNITETFTEVTGRDVAGPKIDQKILRPKKRTRTKEIKTVIREPYEVDVPYTEEVTVEDFEDVVTYVKVQIPKPRIETYTEKVPIIKTRTEYVDVEKRVPYVETKTVTEMAPEKRTRTVFKTDVRTVAELKPEVYFESVKETFTRTVYKKKVRDVPVNRAEITWVKVPKVLKKTIFKTVKRKVKRPALRRVPVRVPYQVEVRIPRRVCTMVPHTITIPVEECCVHCTLHLPGVRTATDAWMEYSREQAARMFWWIRDE